MRLASPYEIELRSASAMIKRLRAVETSPPICLRKRPVICGCRRLRCGSWVLGRRYPTAEGHAEFPPLIRPASRRPPLLSFSNLIEAHVLRSLRTEHGVSVKALRSALDHAENALGINRLRSGWVSRLKPAGSFLIGTASSSNFPRRSTRHALAL